MGSVTDDTVDLERVREQRDYDIRVRCDAIFVLLVEIWHRQCPGTVIDRIEAEMLKLAASRAVALTIPSREHHAMVHAEQVFAEVVDDAIRDTQVTYDDDRGKLVIAAALEQMGLMLKRVGAVSTLSAYRQKLDGER